MVDVNTAKPLHGKAPIVFTNVSSDQKVRYISSPQFFVNMIVPKKYLASLVTEKLGGIVCTDGMLWIFMFVSLKNYCVLLKRFDVEYVCLGKRKGRWQKILPSRHYRNSHCFAAMGGAQRRAWSNRSVHGFCFASSSRIGDQCYTLEKRFDFTHNKKKTLC